MVQFPPLIGRGLRDASPVIRATPDPPWPTLPRKQKLLSNTDPVLERHVMRLRLFCRVSLANDGVTKTRTIGWWPGRNDIISHRCLARGPLGLALVTAEFAGCQVNALLGYSVVHYEPFMSIT